jgi:hypothetical protein
MDSDGRDDSSHADDNNPIPDSTTVYDNREDNQHFVNFFNTCMESKPIPKPKGRANEFKTLRLQRALGKLDHSFKGARRRHENEKQSAIDPEFRLQRIREHLRRLGEPDASPENVQVEDSRNRSRNSSNEMRRIRDIDPPSNRRASLPTALLRPRQKPQSKIPS